MTEHLNPVRAAYYLARQAHEGQVDKAGYPYIEHPIRVKRAMPPEDTASQIVAVLHDVVEDTALTIPELVLFGFSEEIVRAVDTLTHRKGEPYKDYVKRVAQHPLARRVKLADIADNADEARLAQLRPEERERPRQKYAWARAYLEGEGEP